MSYPTKQSPEQWAKDLDFAGLERQHGLPAGVLTNLVRQESRGNCNATSPVGAQGICQFMPATAAQLGVDPRDPKSSAEGAAKYLEQMMDMFDGDPAKAIAAYNCGPGNVRKAIARGKTAGDDWRAHLPNETKNYLALVGKDIGESFVQRETANDWRSPAEKKAAEEAEAERRQRELNEAGLKLPQGSDILSALFFMLIKSFLETKYNKIEANGPVAGPDVVPVQSISPAETVSPLPTPVTPAPAAAPATTPAAGSPTIPVRTPAAATR